MRQTYLKFAHSRLTNTKRVKSLFYPSNETNILKYASVHRLVRVGAHKTREALREDRAGSLRANDFRFESHYGCCELREKKARQTIVKDVGPPIAVIGAVLIGHFPILIDVFP